MISAVRSAVKTAMIEFATPTKMVRFLSSYASLVDAVCISAVLMPYQARGARMGCEAVSEAVTRGFGVLRIETPLWPGTMTLTPWFVPFTVPLRSWGGVAGGLPVMSCPWTESVPVIVGSARASA